MTARAVLLLIAPLIALALPACAQEPETILNQKEWSVGGVRMGGEQYFTCATTDASHSDDSLWLQVTELANQNLINEVSVMHPGDTQATASFSPSTTAIGSGRPRATAARSWRSC
jgi:hypothetical protein